MRTIHKTTPECKDCKFFGGKGKCNHPTKGGNYSHIVPLFWCCLGEFKDINIHDNHKLLESEE